MPPQSSSLFGGLFDFFMPKAPSRNLPPAGMYPGIRTYPRSSGNSVGDILSSLRNMDMNQILQGINTVRTFLENASKVARTLSQLAETLSTINKISKSIDMERILSLLQPPSESTDGNSDPDAPSEQGTEPAEEKTSRPVSRAGKKRPKAKGKKRRSRKRRATSTPVIFVPPGATVRRKA